MAESLLFWAGLGAILAGGIWALLPSRLRRWRQRRNGLWAVATGAVIAVTAWALPPPRPRHASGESLHDQFAPIYEFFEVHAIEVHAPRERVDAAIRGVTAGEIFLFRTLTSLRRMGRGGPENILNVPEHKPVLEVATQTSFWTLANAPGKEIVVGTLVIRPPGWRVPDDPTLEWFRGLEQPGFALATMSFSIHEISPELFRVVTETRVHATDERSRRAFARYWRVIYPGSVLIRRQWLQAIRRRAEADAPP